MVRPPRLSLCLNSHGGSRSEVLRRGHPQPLPRNEHHISEVLLSRPPPPLSSLLRPQLYTCTVALWKPLGRGGDGNLERLFPLRRRRRRATSHGRSRVDDEFTGNNPVLVLLSPQVVPPLSPPFFLIFLACETVTLLSLCSFYFRQSRRNWRFLQIKMGSPLSISPFSHVTNRHL